jgi:hypothetical protein
MFSMGVLAGVRALGALVPGGGGVGRGGECIGRAHGLGDPLGSGPETGGVRAAGGTGPPVESQYSGGATVFGRPEGDLLY